MIPGWCEYLTPSWLSIELTHELKVVEFCAADRRSKTNAIASEKPLIVKGMFSAEVKWGLDKTFVFTIPKVSNGHRNVVI